MHKKIFQFLTLALLCLSCGIMMTSCSDDDDKGEPKSKTALIDNLQGTWVFDLMKIITVR